jgi:hypothetical protein
MQFLRQKRRPLAANKIKHLPRQHRLAFGGVSANRVEFLQPCVELITESLDVPLAGRASMGVASEWDLIDHLRGIAGFAERNNGKGIWCYLVLFVRGQPRSAR